MSLALKARCCNRRWALRTLATGAAVLALGSIPRPLVSLGPQRSVSTRNPKMGMHTRLTDEVEEWKIKRTLEMVREAGCPWIVDYFPWAYIESAMGKFSWEHSDLVVRHARRQGLKIIARLGYPPGWTKPVDTATTLLTEDRYDDFASFCARFCQRYSDDIGHIIIWNEPNLALEWGFRSPDPGAYAALLRLCYQAIKSETPAMVVLAGALAPVSAPLEDTVAMDDLTFLSRCYEQGIASHFDALAVHSYGWVYPPEDEPERGKVNFRRAELIREIMVQNGDGDKKCYLTEAGWNDHPRWTRAVSSAQRLEYTVRAYDLALREWPWCEALAMWAFRFPWPQRSYQDYFTFVTPEFQPKPVYQAVQSYAFGQ